MNYEQFKESIINTLDQKYHGEHGDIQVWNIQKINEEVEELVFVHPDYNYMPGIWMDRLYELYLKNGMDNCVTLVDLALRLQDQVDPEVFFKSWEEARKRIYPELINRQWNQQRLEELVSEPYLDLAVVFRLYLGPEENKKLASVLIDKVMVEKLWGGKITEKAIKETGYGNLKREKFAIAKIYEKKEKDRKTTVWHMMRKKEKRGGAAAM